MAGAWDRGVLRCRESAELFRGAADASGEARALIWMAINLSGISDGDDVGAANDAAIEAARRSEGAVEQALALGLAGIWLATRDPDRALGLVEEGAAAIQTAPSPNWIAHSGEFHAGVRYLRGEHDEARALLADALPLYVQIANRGCLAHCFEAVGAVAAATGRAERAAELMGAAEKVREALGTTHPAYERMVRDSGLAQVRTALDAATLTSAWARGRDLTLEQATERAREVVGAAASTGRS